MAVDDYGLADQAQTDTEVTSAITGGEGHVYYGLAAVAGLSLYVLLVGGQWVWLAVVFILVLGVGVMVDLFAHGYTH